MKNIISIEQIKEGLNIKTMGLLLIAFLCMAIWLFGAYEFILEGHESYNLTRTHPWGLLLVVYEFFVALAMGLGIVGASAIVFDIKAIKPYAIKAILYGLVSLFAGFSVFLFEIGHPITMIIYVAISGNVTSPLFWLGVFYPAFMSFSALTLFFAWKKDEAKVKLFAFGTLLSSIASILTAGSIFGLLYVIPFAAGPFYPVQFILTAVLSGIFILAFVFWVSDSKSFELKNAVEFLGKFARIIIAILLIMFLTRYLSSIYSSEYALSTSIKAMYASNEFLILELFLGLILPFMVLVLVKENLAKILGIVAVPALFGMMMSRYNLVEGLQYIAKKDVKTLEYSQSIVPAFNYFPSISEIALSLGGLGICIILYFISSLVWNSLTQEK